MHGGKAAATGRTSQVIYTDPAARPTAKEVAKTLGLPASAVKKGTVPSNADVTVVLGKDYKPLAARRPLTAGDAGCRAVRTAERPPAVGAVRGS